MKEPELTDAQFDTLRAAVTLAKNNQVQNVQSLSNQLRRHGHKDEDVKAAIDYWGWQNSRSEALHY